MKLPHPFVRPALVLLATLVLSRAAAAADKYTGTCNIRFEADSTLHAFTGVATNIPVVVFCETNAAGSAVLHARVEMAPKQLSTDHKKRDANMYKMFQADRFPRLIAGVTNASLDAAKLVPTTAATNAPGTLPIQFTFCGLTKEVAARTSNPKPLPQGWEFDLAVDISLKDFKLKPSSALFGAISVDDKVVVKAHVIVKK
jgi:hypothetical protein